MGHPVSPGSAHTADGADDAMVSSVGSQLRLARQRAHISLRSMAERTGYSKSHLSNVETGTFPVTEQLLQRYQRALANNQKDQEDQEEIEGKEAAIMNSAQNPEWDVVISGTTSALAKKDRWRLETEIDEPVARVCKSMDLRCFVPQRFTNRQTELPPDLPGEYNIIAHSGVLIAYVGVNDSRTGLQLGWAHVAQIPIILLYELGNSEIADEYRQQQLAIHDTICFRNQDDLVSQLFQTLFWLFSERNLEKVSKQNTWSSELTGKKQRQLNDLRLRGKKLTAAHQPISEKQWLSENPFFALEHEELQRQS